MYFCKGKKVCSFNFGQTTNGMNFLYIKKKHSKGSLHCKGESPFRKKLVVKVNLKTLILEGIQTFRVLLIVLNHENMQNKERKT